jgi:hypothetical protein
MAANITLRLDEKLLRRLRRIAVDRNTSLSAWVTEVLTRAADELDGFEPARQRAFQALQQPVSVTSGPLTRDQAHAR